jgi:hypothetical protein
MTVSKFDHLAKFPRGIDVEERERGLARIKRF